MTLGKKSLAAAEQKLLELPGILSNITDSVVSNGKGKEEDTDRSIASVMSNSADASQTADLHRQLTVKSLALETLHTEYAALLDVLHTAEWIPNTALPPRRLSRAAVDTIATKSEPSSVYVNASVQTADTETQEDIVAQSRPRENGEAETNSNISSEAPLHATTIKLFSLACFCLPWLWFRFEFRASDEDTYGYGPIIASCMITAGAVFGFLAFERLFRQEIPSLTLIHRHLALHIFRDPRAPVSLHPILPSFILQLLRPKIRPGSQRLEWECSCGQPMYGDYTDSAEERAAKERWEGSPALNASGSHLTGVTCAPHESPSQIPAHDAVTQPSGPSDNCEHAASSTSSSTSRSRHSSVSGGDGSELSRESSSTSISLPSSEAVPVQSYLEICINRNKYLTRVGEIPIVNADGDYLVKSDFELFGKLFHHASNKDPTRLSHYANERRTLN